MSFKEQRAVAVGCLVTCGMALLCYGIGLMLPADTFASSPIAYKAMSDTGIPEIVWGFIIASIGAVGLWSMSPKASRMHSLAGRGIISGRLVGLCVMYLVAVPYGVIGWLILPLALMALFSAPYVGMT